MNKLRSDITFLVKFFEIKHRVNEIENSNVIVHLTHQEIVHHDLQALPNPLKYFASCHDEQSIRGCDELAKTHSVMGCFLSPVLPTPTHPESEGIGWEKFAELAQTSDVPVYGLGGLKQDNLKKIRKNNGFGIAGIRLLQDI